MGNRIDTETQVSYHRDNPFAMARPAVNVKVNFGRMDLEYDEIAHALDEYPESGVAHRTNRLYEIAQEQVFEAFWIEAATKADELGLGEIEQEGHSGGWLVLAEGRDLSVSYDRKASIAERSDWLAAYRQLAAWCAERVAAAPAEIAKLARELAIEEVENGSVAVRALRSI